LPLLERFTSTPGQSTLRFSSNVPAPNFNQLKTIASQLNIQLSRSGMPYTLSFPALTSGVIQFTGIGGTSVLMNLNLPSFVTGGLLMFAISIRSISLPNCVSLSSFSLGTGQDALFNLSLPLLKNTTTSITLPSSLSFLNLDSMVIGGVICSACRVAQILLPSLGILHFINMLYKQLLKNKNRASHRSAYRPRFVHAINTHPVTCFSKR